MGPDATDPPVDCPACDAPRQGRGGAWSTCTHCGHRWPANAIEVPAGDPLDSLAVGAQGVAVLAEFLHGPPTPAELERAEQAVAEISSR